MSQDPLQSLIFDSLSARTSYEGNVSFPCVPSAIDHYERILHELFTRLGKSLAADEMARVRNLLEQNLHDGYQRGGSNFVVVSYQVTTSPTLRKNLGVRVGIQSPTLDEQFDAWSAKRGEDLFGSHPDARVLSIIKQLGAPAAVLDVGSGPGRNALPLAREGWQVDAVELTPAFSDKLEQQARAELLPLRVIRGDILDARTVIPSGKYAFAFACEVVSHFRYGPWLRDFLERMCDAVRPGGYLLFNVFLPRSGYQPTDLAREMSEVAWATIFTRPEVEDALRGLPLKLLADDSVYDYESKHLPPSAWPPTRWFAAWSRGYSIFPLTDQQLPPVEMRWLLFERLK